MQLACVLFTAIPEPRYVLNMNMSKTANNQTPKRQEKEEGHLHVD